MIVNPVIGCEALSYALVILHKAAGSEAQMEKVEAALKTKWESIDDPSARLEAGYDVAVALADHAREKAEAYLRATDQLKAEHSDLTGPTYINCLRLAIRAFSGLLPRQLQSSNDFERLALQIERVPSRLVRVSLWSELAMRCFKNERSDDGKKVVNQRIRPLLDKLRQFAEFEWREAVSFAAPALYETNSATALDLISTLSGDSRDRALNRVLRFRVMNVTPWDPLHEDADAAYNLDVSACVEVLKVAELFDMDARVYKYIALAGCGKMDSATWILSSLGDFVILRRVLTVSADVPRIHFWPASPVTSA
jgi:hypothetical protein